ncbi:MAG TPA: hypothetical protein VMV27_15560 [Candidatus Binataceae bacterium]|nr:hypothetical protein [Candidatus Binataceae bacterium]
MRLIARPGFLVRADAASLARLWAALGLSPSEATSALTSARETAGATSLSNRGAYRGMRSATLMGLTPQESAATVGGAARLGVDPSKWIDIVERGTTRANQNGQQSEINSALLMYLKRQSEISAVDETAAQKTVMRVASILGASGLPAFKGAGAVAGVAAIAAANQPGDLFGIGTTGSAITLMGKANILSAINADSTMSKLSSTDKIAMADRILTQGFTGPNAGMFLKSVVAPEIKMARSMGLYGTEAIEKQFHLPPGAKTDKLLYGKLLDAADAANVDDWNKYAPANLGAKKIAPMTSARATHLHGRALTAEAASGTYASAQYLEAAGLSKLRGYIRDPATASIIDKLTHELTPEASKLPGAVPTARPSYPLGPGEHPLGGAPVAGPGAVQVFADGFVGMIAAIEKLIAVEQGRANSGKPAYEPEPPMPPVTVHGTTRSTAATPRVTPAH